MAQEDNLVIMVDENGNDVKFEFLDSIETEGNQYIVLLPLEQEEDGEVQIFKIVEGNEELYIDVDNDEELEKVFNIFKERASDEFDFE